MRSNWMKGLPWHVKVAGVLTFAKYDLDNSTSDLENAIVDFSKAIRTDARVCRGV